MRTLPELAVRMHPMIESSVVLPLPEGPISRSNSPACTSRSMPRNASVPAAPSSYFFVRSLTSIADCIMLSYVCHSERSEESAVFSREGEADSSSLRSSE
jgi:hypothetical protein